MSAVQYGLTRIKRDIPTKLLELAFLRKSDYYGVRTTLDKQITDLVINQIVLKDTNIVGGISLKLPLSDCDLTLYEDNATGHNIVINVPYRFTKNKKILEALSLSIGSLSSGGGMSNANPMVNGINAISRHLGGANGYITSDLEIIAPNTILVYDNININSFGTLEVMVENNTNLSNISKRSHLKFGELCVLAAKLFIYNKLVLDIDAGVLYNGHELGKLTDLVNSFEGSGEEYYDYLDTKWTKIMFMNDKKSMSEFLHNAISPNI